MNTLWLMIPVGIHACISWSGSWECTESADEATSTCRDTALAAISWQGLGGEAYPCLPFSPVIKGLPHLLVLWSNLFQKRWKSGHVESDQRSGVLFLACTEWEPLEAAEDTKQVQGISCSLLCSLVFPLWHLDAGASPLFPQGCACPFWLLACILPELGLGRLHYIADCIR